MKRNKLRERRLKIANRKEDDEKMCYMGLNADGGIAIFDNPEDVKRIDNLKEQGLNPTVEEVLNGK